MCIYFLISKNYVKIYYYDAWNNAFYLIIAFVYLFSFLDCILCFIITFITIHTHIM